MNTNLNLNQSFHSDVWRKSITESETTYQCNDDDNKVLNQVIISRDRSGRQRIQLVGRGTQSLLANIKKEIGSKYSDDIFIINKDIYIPVRIIYEKHAINIQPLLEHINIIVEKSLPIFAEISSQFELDLKKLGFSYVQENVANQQNTNRSVFTLVSTISNPKTYTLSDGRITTSFWDWHEDNVKKDKLKENNTVNLDKPKTTISNPITYTLSDGRITTSLWDWHEDNVKKDKLKENNTVKLDKPKELDFLLEKNLKKSAGWTCTEYDNSDYRGHTEKFWTIKNRDACLGKIYEFNLILNVNISYSGQYDAYGVYELNGDKEVNTSRGCKFKIFQSNENQKITEDEFINSIKEKMPKVSLRKIVTEEKEYRNFEEIGYLYFSISEVPLKQICNYLVDEGHIPKEDLLNYISWWQKGEEEYIKKCKA